ncbi:hypothetical protein AYI69_g5910 [Smittium culicis]|uniref:Uncharacterized protein n=1 Tax=Smittium culicis TaxID=133412 RepID=A0A1R1Y3D3_9FUNG|nr:hypothetical protein AYI69_g5910 [Smittium culicis]
MSTWVSGELRVQEAGSIYKQFFQNSEWDSRKLVKLEQANFGQCKNLQIQKSLTKNTNLFARFVTFRARNN